MFARELFYMVPGACLVGGVLLIANGRNAVGLAFIGFAFLLALIKLRVGGKWPDP